MEFPRRVFDGEGVKGDVDFGPTLMLNRNRCILCTRCVRFMRDVDGDAQINIIDRGYGSEIATFQEEGVHSLISGNLMDVCPVGAITTRDYRFKSRPWDNPNAVDTICTLCSKGCNTTAWLKAKPEWAKGSRLIRFTPRFNPDVNGYWMCDIGRFDYHWIEGDDRLRRPLDAGRSRAFSSRRRGTTRCAKLARACSTAAGTANPDGVRFLSRRTRRTKSCSCSAGSPKSWSATRRRVDGQLAVPRRSRSRTARSSRCPPVDAPNVNGARDVRVRAGSVGDESATRTSRRFETRSSRAGRGALRVRSRARGLARRRQWIVDARAGGTLPLLIVQGVLLTRAGAGRRFRAAGRIVRREGSVLYQRPGTAAGRRRARSRRRAKRWKTGRFS